MKVGLLNCVIERLQLCVQVPEPEFEGQTKTRLGNPEVRKIVEGIVSQVSKELPGQLTDHMPSRHTLPMPLLISTIGETNLPLASC